MKVTIQLNEEQMSACRPLYDAVCDAMNKTSLDLSRDERGAIFGQMYHDGEVEFYYCTKEQALTVRRAVKRANIDDTTFRRVASPK